MLSRRILATCVAALCASAGLTACVHAAAITAGNLVAVRVSTGTTGATSAISLDEYTPSGTFVQSISVAGTGTSALTVIGTSTTEGTISPSQDGNSLIFAGYRKDAGSTSNINVAATARVVGTVGLTGIVDTSFEQTNSLFGTGNIRSATTVSGTNYYLGTSNGVYYASGSTPVAIDTRNSRQVFLASYAGSANGLLASNGSTTISQKVQSYGNAPTGSTTPTTVVAYSGTGDAVHGIYFLDLSSTVAGADTAYVLNTVNSRLEKYTYNGTAWSASGTTTSSATNLTAATDGTNVSLWLSTGSALQRLNDTSGYGGTLAGTPASIVTAGTGTAFRGLGILGGTFVPIPEPTSIAVVAGVALLGLRRRAAGR
jgi:hypothetical protein